MTGGPDFDRFRELLENERTRLQHARAAIHHDGSLLEETGDLAIGSGDHIADSASETFMRELDEGLEENADHLLAEIEAALARIDDGTYGRCESCGDPIGKARMQAFPRATLCVACKQRTERR